MQRNNSVGVMSKMSVYWVAKLSPEIRPTTLNQQEAIVGYAGRDKLAFSVINNKIKLTKCQEIKYSYFNLLNFLTKKK